MSSLRRYLVTVVVALVLLILAATALLAYQVDRFGQAQAERQLLETTKALSLVTDGELKRSEAILRSLLLSERLQRNDWQGLDRQARALISGSAAWIVVGDRAGRQLVNTRLPAGATLPSGTPPREMWAILDRGRSRICDLTRGIVEARILCVDVPVMRGGRAAYHLSVVMRPDLLRSVIEPQRLQKGSFLTILDRKGIVIWRNVAADRFVGKPGTRDLLGALARSNEGVRHSHSLEGVPTVAAFNRSAFSGWTFVVAMPREQMRAGTRQAFGLAAAGVLLLLALGILMGLLAARRISRAVGGLSRTTAQLGSGEAPRYQPTGLSEIDAVGEALAQAIHERQAGEERQRLLINELNHRVKNTLAVVQSIAHQTLRGGKADPEVIQSLEARLAALSLAHNVLTKEHWSSASMREIIEEALTPFCPGDRCRAEGPDIRLSPRTAVSFALAIHELATNASKYGALSNETGRVTVAWSTVEGRLKFQWKEQEGPEVTVPSRRGFGTRLLERSLAAELGGTARLALNKEGVTFEVEAPIPQPE